MTIEQLLLASLKTKYSNLGLGDKILSGYAASLAKTVKDEKDIETAVAGVEDQLKIYQSILDSHNTKLSGLQKELEELKKAAPAPADPPKPGDPPKDPPPADPNKDVPEWAKAMLETLKTTQSTLTALQAEKAKNSNREKLIAKLKEKAVNEHFYKTQLKDEFENDEAIEAYALSLKEAESAFMQAITDTKLKEQPAPVFGRVKDEKTDVSPDVQAFIESKKPKQ